MEIVLPSKAQGWAYLPSKAQGWGYMRIVSLNGTVGTIKVFHIWVGQQGLAARALSPCFSKSIVRGMVSQSPIHLGISATLEGKTP